MQKTMMRQSGVTLVELLVVVAVIGILAALFIPRLVSYRQEAADARAVDLADSMRKAVGSYEAWYGSYSGLPRGPNNQATYDAFRTAVARFVPFLPYAEVMEIIDWFEADVDYGAMAGRGYAVLIRARGGTGRFIAAASDGVYFCTGWWSGCTRAR